MARPSRLRIAVVVVGTTFAILMLAFLQVGLPLAFGPGGLVAAILIDAGVVLLYHHRRAARREARRRGPRYSLIVWGPVDRRYAVRRVDALEKDIAASALVTSLMLIIFAVSYVLYAGSPWIQPTFPVFFAAGLMLLATARIVEGLMFTPLPTEAERWDTTDDH